MNRVFPVLLAAWCAAAACAQGLYKIESVAGSSSIGDGGPAMLAQIGNMQGIAIDRLGNIYFSDTDRNLVRKVDIRGIITTIAGTGVPGFGGDGGPAAAAQLNLPYGLAADLAGNLYIADLGNNRVRRIGPEGLIVTVAGTGVKASSADGGLAANAALLTPRNLAVDAAGALYISEFEGHRVRKVTPDGRISTAAGTGIAGFRGDGGSALNAQIGFPAGLAIDRAGSLYIADSQNQRIRKILPGGVIATVLGGSSATALLTPIAVAVDNAGTIFAGDASGIVRSYSLGGGWLNIVGTGTAGFSGDGGPSVKAALSVVRDLAVDLAGDLFLADGVRIREVDLKGNIQTVAGDGFLRAVGDGGPPLNALLNRPAAVALDRSGNLYIADAGTQRVRILGPSAAMQTFAGTGAAGYSSDQVAPATAMLNAPAGVAADQYGNVFIADTLNHRVRQVGANGRIATFAGTGTAGVGPELLPGAQTQLQAPRGICVSRTGTVYIVDTSNHRVLRASASALVETAAGNGSAGFAGDGGAARSAELNQPSACALDSSGSLFIADTFNHRIAKVTPAGIISTVAGVGVAGTAGDNGRATAAQLDTPRGLAVNDNGDIFIADTGSNRIRQVTSDGLIHTIAGGLQAGFAGDGDFALKALLNAPGGLFLDGAGALYFADSNNNRVRRLTPAAAPPPPAPISDPVTLPPAIVVVSAASLQTGPIAPGEIVTIYGTAIGPQAGVPGSADASGLFANILGGAEVRFDGVPAPLFYAQAGQINAQAPYTTAGQAVTHLEVRYLGQVAGAGDAAVVAAAPALFPTILNQDGSLNSAANPAAAGASLILFATGEGLTDGSNVSGATARPPFAQPQLPVTLLIGDAPATLLYAGSAPDEAGVLQINALVPPGAASGSAVLQLTVGTFAAPPLVVWIL